MFVPSVDPSLQAEQGKRLLPCVGRTAEMQMFLSVLTTVIEDVEVGARALTISGEVGIGKTFLLARVCEEARKRNMRVLEMRGYEYSQTFPYFPFIEMLRQVCRGSTLDQLRFSVGLPHAIEHTHEVPTSEEKIVLTGVPLVTALARVASATAYSAKR
jgi:hypothetical protein